METLENTTVWRGGISTFRRTKVAGNVNIRSRPTISSPEKSVELDLLLPVARGLSEVSILIGEKDYVTVLKAMAEADREAALLAMATVLTEHLADMKKVRDDA